MFFRNRSHLIKVLLSALLIFITTLLVSPDTDQAVDVPTPSLLSNTITIENLKKGNTDWQLTNPATRTEIEGYASLTSVNRGAEIKFFVNTKDPSYTIKIFRMGWYDGAGGRQMASAITRKRVKQPPPIVDPATGLIECNWRDPYILKIPNNPKDPTQWASGIYLAKLTASKTQKQSYIIFVVRDDSRPSDILFQSSVTTYQAYNNWGGMSLYRWNSRGKQAQKVSFNRPYAASPNLAAAYGVGAGEFLTNSQPKRRTSSAGWEYNMVRWLEREGYDVVYCTDIDTHVNPLEEYSSEPMLLSHKAFLSVGHDEYWSWEMRQNVELAREKSISLGFFSSNTCYWQIRFEPSRVTKDVNRIIVAYKENSILDPFARDGDPSNDYLITTRWRKQPVNFPEDSLIGVMYETFQVNADIVINHTAPDWLLADTQLSRESGVGNGEWGQYYSDKQKLETRFLGETGFLAPPQSLTEQYWEWGRKLVAFVSSMKGDRLQSPVLKEIRLPGLLGYEVDRMFGNAPANTIRIAHSPYRYKNGIRYADMTVYKTDSGATVFATGSMQWSWGLDDYNAPKLRPNLVNGNAQAITRNVLAQMIRVRS